MSEKYTPDETELANCYAHVLEDRAGEDYATAKADAERGIAAIKAKARAEAFNDARHNMQLSLDAAIKPIRADAWDEGASTGYLDAQGALRGAAPRNPYRIEEEA